MRRTNGVEAAGDVKKYIGMALKMSSKTGFTQRAENIVHFGRTGWLCGVFGPLSNRPVALVARQR
ncbi:hypothetical protein GCM10028801_46040 [Nocardioides maradonensis]